MKLRWIKWFDSRGLLVIPSISNWKGYKGRTSLENTVLWTVLGLCLAVEKENYTKLENQKIHNRLG